ncbi:MAG: pseudouridine synthase [Dehalococcoidia bacterium]
MRKKPWKSSGTGELGEDRAGPGRGSVIRLQKLIAGAGLASRRAAERLIRDGRVSVNGVVVRELGASATPGRDQVRVDGNLLTTPAEKTYLLLYKPRGVVSSTRDPHAARTVMSLLPANSPRLFPVGRLDRESEGLLLLTDDGDLTERMLHPRYRLEREYAVLVRGAVAQSALTTMRAGAEVEGAHVRPLCAEVMPPPTPIDGASAPGTCWLRITLTEGRKREVRVLCSAAGLTVLRLIRVRFGPLTLGPLPSGHTRPLTAAEMTHLIEPQRHKERRGREVDY